jgi:bla regulator protein BlaR1
MRLPLPRRASRIALTLALPAWLGVALSGLAAPPPTAPAGMAAGIQGEVPRYPSRAQAEGEGGLVVLRLRVGADGRVLESQFVAERSTVPYGSPLVRSTLEAAREWRIDPPMQDGKPVEGWVMVPVRFEPDLPPPEN